MAIHIAVFGFVLLFFLNIFIIFCFWDFSFLIVLVNFFVFLYNNIYILRIYKFTLFLINYK